MRPGNIPESDSAAFERFDKLMRAIVVRATGADVVTLRLLPGDFHLAAARRQLITRARSR